MSMLDDAFTFGAVAKDDRAGRAEGLPAIDAIFKSPEDGA